MRRHYYMDIIHSVADLRARLPSQPMEQYADAKRMAEAWEKGWILAWERKIGRNP